MGWWSKDIMGGDSPLDFEDEIFGICAVTKFPDDFNFDEDTPAELKKEDFERNLPAILEMLRKQENDDFYDEFAIGFQVLGVLMMKAGAPISDELKAEIRAASETDSWAKEDPERKEIVDGFHKALEAYDGNPIIIKSRGLFEVIADHLASGKEGLVNKGKGIA